MPTNENSPHVRLAPRAHTALRHAYAIEARPMADIASDAVLEYVRTHHPEVFELQAVNPARPRRAKRR
jgi:hypothetical protein